LKRPSLPGAPASREAKRARKHTPFRFLVNAAARVFVFCFSVSFASRPGGRPHRRWRPAAAPAPPTHQVIAGALNRQNERFLTSGRFESPALLILIIRPPLRPSPRRRPHVELLIFQSLDSFSPRLDSGTILGSIPDQETPFGGVRLESAFSEASLAASATQGQAVGLTAERRGGWSGNLTGPGAPIRGLHGSAPTKLRVSPLNSTTSTSINLPLSRSTNGTPPRGHALQVACSMHA
jgi:hypothetical protein